MTQVGTRSLQDQSAFQHFADDLQAWATSVGLSASWDVSVRGQYQVAIRGAVDKVRRQAQSRQISWSAAAQTVQGLRNDLLQVMRGKSSPIGRALAEWLKPKGLTLNELIGRYTIEKFGPAAIFDTLSPTQKNTVYAEIVEAAARSRASVDEVVRRIGKVSRSLLLISLAISIYQIMSSDNPFETAKKEVALTSGGVVGGIVGGAIAGLACGPAAPLCVTAGAFVGGAAAVFGVDYFWD